jgi:hypothetical protein
MCHAKCRNKECGKVVDVKYVGTDYRYEYDGRCPYCGTACPCHEKDLI